MREIKFRLWDNQYKKMKYDAGIVCHGETNLLLFSNFVSGWSIPYILMQFTGFQDENGQDIYEGDIVRYKVFEGSMDSKEDFFEMTSEVKFENGAFYPRPNKFECEDSWYSWETSGFIKLGNIFENPELLSKK